MITSKQLHHAMVAAREELNNQIHAFNNDDDLQPICAGALLALHKCMTVVSTFVMQEETMSSSKRTLESDLKEDR